MRDNNFTGAQFLTTDIRQCLSRYNGQRSRRSEFKSKKAGRKESPASHEASQLLGSSQGSSCSDGEASLGPSSAPASGRTSEAGGSKAGSKEPRPMPPPRKPHTAETLQVRSYNTSCRPGLYMPRCLQRHVPCHHNDERSHVTIYSRLQVAIERSIDVACPWWVAHQQPESPSPAGPHLVGSPLHCYSLAKQASHGSAG